MMKDIIIDKTGWKKCRFGDVAIQTKGVVDIDNTDLTRYIAGEHMNSEDIHLRKWGNVGDGYLGPAFIRRFNKGDILYGSRRTYLKKVAIADFDGITANTTFVIKAKEELIEPILLVHLMLSDSFTEYSVKNSRGSVNPYINWKDIADYEFLLPPKAEQKRLAELLWAADEMIEKEKKEMEMVKVLFNEQKSELIWDKQFDQEKLVTVSNIGLKDGDWIESKDQAESGIRLIQLADIGDGYFINKSSRFISDKTFTQLHCFEIFPNDILLARMPDPIGRSCILPQLNERCITAVDVCVIRVDELKYNTKYINYLINTPMFRKIVIEQSSGTTRQRISRKNLEKIFIPLPSKEVQNNIVKIITEIENLVLSLQNQISVSQQLKQELINKIF